MATAPGLVLLTRQGAPRLLGPSVLEHLELSELPPRVDSVEGLLGFAGFHRRPGSSCTWERDGQHTLLAGEEPAEDGARVVWTLPDCWDEEQARRRVRYLSMASHDLRGSLANIRSYAALLLNGRVPLEPKVQRGLETILRNADRSLSFAQDFFDSSRAELGSLACEPERQPLLPLLDAAVERQQAAVRAAGVALRLDVDPLGHLPEVNVDGGRIQHAVEAFIQHQLSHARPGDTIQVRSRTQGSRVRVEVHREGEPLPEEVAASVFQREERAFREHKLEDPLRVFLARQEVEAHGGSVGVEADARGSSLFLTLPALATPALSPPASLQA